MNRKDISNIKIKDNNLERNIFSHEGFGAGTPPFLRGVNSTVFLNKPIKASFFTDIAIKKETQTYSVDHFKEQCNQVALENTFATISINTNVLPTLAFYITIAQEKKISLRSLKGVFKKDFSCDIPMKHITDILEFADIEMPEFNSIVFSNEFLNTPNTETELAYMLTQSVKFIKKGIDSGLNMDYIVSKISFSFLSGVEIFKETAKIRAARMLWAKLINQLNPKQESSLALSINSIIKTNKTGSKEKRFETISRNTLKSMPAIFGGTQNLLTDSFNQKGVLFLEKETGVTKTIDPWAGSYYLEELTQDITLKTWKAIQGINTDSHTKESVLKNLFKEKTNQNLIPTEKKSAINFKSNRIESEVQETLNDLMICVKTGKGNLLDLTIKSVKKRATLQEITNILQED